MRIYPVRAATLSDAIGANATRILEGYYTRSGAGLAYQAVVEDAASHRDQRELSASSGLSAGITDAAREMSRALDKRQRPFPTQNAAALRFWAEAQLEANPAERAARFEKAIAADPNFGLAYVDLAAFELQRGDRAGAQRTLARASQRSGLFSDFDRARLALLDATANNRRDAQRTALRELTRLAMTDARLLETLAEVELASRHFDAASDAYRTVLAMEPGNASAMNGLGYAEAYRGSLEGAISALNRYKTAAPNQPNPLDSLAEVHFLLGKFGDAERYFLEAYRTNPTFLGGQDLLKAAEARLMQGNLSGADELFQKYNEARRKGGDAAASIEQAQWLYMTGRRKQAVSALETGLGNVPASVRSYAEAQLAVWALDAGDRARAAEFAQRAARDASNQSLAALAAICRFIAQQRAGASDWERAAEQVFSDPASSGLKQAALAYGLLYARQFGSAAQVLKPMYAAASPVADGDVRTLYAWALVESGKLREAEPLVQQYPMMLSAAPNAVFSALVFPRFLALRAAVLNSSADLHLFRMYAGDAPGISNAPDDRLSTIADQRP